MSLQNENRKMSNRKKIPFLTMITYTIFFSDGIFGVGYQESEGLPSSGV
ncbi:MAG: hypothetical protein KAK04_18495 [Cyclobacteriaceae bacterium]|nr:hypothetical protein [Cyclobacteriaceae bacterium]